ncbi:MAG: HK97 family phage prohead protease [Clostridia bacterium]|nr:HK97 family phage prohead protease [Clostridia bacterium]
MPQKNDREYRNIAGNLAPQEDEKRVTGYATTFGVPYKLYGSNSYEIWEVIDKNAFDKTDMDDVIMQYDHEGRVFARTRNNTLALRSDEHGLLIDADLSGTELGRQLYEEIKGGYTDKMSFGFTVRGDKWEDEMIDGVQKSTRTITDIGKLYDVSAVSIPANDSTSLSVRSLTDGAIERLKAERLERERVEALEARRAALRERINNG